MSTRDISLMKLGYNNTRSSKLQALFLDYPKNFSVHSPAGSAQDLVAQLPVARQVR